MLVLRRAGAADLDFLVHADLQEEGYTRSEDEERESAAEHREKICSFLRDANKAAWVYEDKGIRVAAILCAFRDLHNEPKEAHGLHFYRSAIPRATFPEDGRFCEVFNLWVERPYRRRGLATKLKEQLEVESRARGVRLVYTHTEETNPHVLALNEKMGYREIRRGPIWDEVVRVSLVKEIDLLDGV